MIRWLLSLFSKPEPPPTAPVPVDWQPPHPTDDEQAIVLAFLKAADRKARRDQVMRVLTGRLDGLLLPSGFVREQKRWVRDLRAGRAVVAIKRFSGGYDATLEIEFVPKRKPAHIYAGLLTTQLPNFVQMAERTFARNGSIIYAFVDHDPTALDFPLAVLRDRALPWLLDHGAGQYPDKTAYRERPLQPSEA